MKTAPLISLLVQFALSSIALGQTVVTRPDPEEKPGDRPYEMVWANRVEPGPPTLRFDSLTNWSMHVQNGAQATLQTSRAQNVWNRPVARLRYKGDGNRDSKPAITIKLPQPIPLPIDSDSVDLWAFGNRWDWENPPDTPPVRLALQLRDANGQEQTIDIDRVRWKEWWLAHKRLGKDVTHPARLESIQVLGGWQSDWRELFFDSIRFYKENPAPLTFAPRPKRNLELKAAQIKGANIGPGKLPFPTTPWTILPTNLISKFKNGIQTQTRSAYDFTYRGADAVVTYQFNAEDGLGSLKATLNGALVGNLLQNAQLRSKTVDASGKKGPVEIRAANNRIRASYPDSTLVSAQINQKTFVIDLYNPSDRWQELQLGELTGLTEPRLISIPYLTYGGGPQPSVLLSRAGTNWVFTSIWTDWYQSNGSEPYAAASVTTNTARINGGVRYHPRTDGKRNPVFERIFITVSPKFEEVLPTIPNPAGLHAREAVDWLWQESWGPDNYEQQMKRSRMLRAYGIEKLIQCNHEIAWRDGGESFTLRTRAAPKKGGDNALKNYVAHQRSLGWKSGLYSNYTDFAPVNEFWSPDGVQRATDGQWRTAWPRCYAEKPLKAVEFDALLAPQIKKKFNPNSAYTDVHTAVAPWHYTDYDARVPGAATFAQTFYAYGELLRNDSRVYGGPIFSEGTYQWLYAGLADGNYALAYNGRPLANEPLLPVFDLCQIHTKECDIGMGWTANFCEAIPGWQKPEHIDRAIDRFLLNTMAYGHIGWLVEESHGLSRTTRSYYMLQQVQTRYGLKPPTRIAYWDGTNLCAVSEALVKDLPRTRRQLFVQYPGGLQLWLNDHPTENWTLSDIGTFGQTKTGSAKTNRRANSPPNPLPDLILPPAGWAAFDTDGALFSSSSLQDTNKVDYIRSPDYIYFDGRGHWFETPEAAANGALVIRPIKRNHLEVIRISGDGLFVIRRPYRARGQLLSCEAYDVEGKQLVPPTWNESPNGTEIRPTPNAIRYLLRFGSR